MCNEKVFYAADGVSLQSSVGDIVHVKDFIAILLKRGFRVILAIRNNKTSRDPIIEKLALLALPSLNFPWSFLSYVISLILMPLALLSHKPEYIYARDNGVNISVIVGKLLRIPVFLEINGDLRKEYDHLNKIISFLVINLMKLSYRSADKVIIPSQRQASFIINMGVEGKKIVNIPNGVNPILFHPMDKSLCRAKLALPKSIYFCFVGHLAPWQGIENAIIALSKIIRDNDYVNVKLILVGDGPLRKQLEKLSAKLKLEKNVLFFGSILHENVPTIINASDICIAPFTAWRNKEIGVSPLKLFEYLSCGKPVVGTLIPGTEIIQRLDAGILVEPDNVEELKNAFKKAIGMLPYWEKKAQSLHENIAKNHSWDCRIDDILQIMYAVSKKNS